MIDDTVVAGNLVAGNHRGTAVEIFAVNHPSATRSNAKVEALHPPGVVDAGLGEVVLSLASRREAGEQMGETCECGGAIFPRIRS